MRTCFCTSQIMNTIETAAHVMVLQYLALRPTRIMFTKIVSRGRATTRAAAHGKRGQNKEIVIVESSKESKKLSLEIKAGKDSDLYNDWGNGKVVHGGEYQH